MIKRTLPGLLLFALVTAGAFAAEPLDLELAFSSRKLPSGDRPVLSPDGRWLAYEIEVPLLETPEGGGGRFLEDGLPADALGLRLFVSDTRTGASRAVCGETTTCWRGQWSPDSRLLAFYADEGDEIGLRVWDAANGSARRLGTVRIKPRLWHGDQASWSPDSKTIFVPGWPAEPEEKKDTAAAAPARAAGPKVRVYTSAATAATAGAEAAQLPVDVFNGIFIKENNAAILAVDAGTGESRVVVAADAEHRPNVFRLSPDGKWLSYLTVYRLREATSTDTFEDLVVVPASGGAPVTVVRDIKMPDDDYFGGTYRWALDSSRIVYLNEGLWVVDVPSRGAPRRLAESLGDLTDSPILLTADGTRALVGLESKEEKVYYDVPARAFALVPLDGYDARVLDVTGEPVKTGDGTLLQPAADRIYFMRSVEGKPQTEVLEIDARTGASTRLWLGDGRFRFVGTADGRTIVARFEGLKTPANYFLLDQRFATLRRLSNVEPRLDALSVGSMESFETLLPGHDGKMHPVQTYVLLPGGAKRGDRVPTIVFFYSGSSLARSAQQFGGGAPNSIPVQVFTSRGYAVLFCDTPLGPQGKPGNPIQEMTDAIVAQVNRAAALGYSDIERMAIMGQSYGGYSTAAVISATRLFRAGAALDGVYDLGGTYGRLHPSGASIGYLWSEGGQGRMGSHPWADLRRYIENSPYYRADRIRTPLLLIHGEKDDTCPVDEAGKMFNAIKRLGGEVELAIYEGEGHVPGEWGVANAVDATQRMIDFFDRHVRSKE